ncbi:ABC transporter ATP-binding protein [Motiliproteus sp. SC1-56]|uniref:ABC transporter ATP-binding protein n=1 Tax=Motiliproteus sp. SC1-56 TaxID=2799565 RepID=UPI001A8D3D9E|nr:ABC transporter ATP-binding protein [Motiliproteus sp. SC1-56]
MSNLFEVRNLDVCYGPVQALRDVNVEIKKGEIVTLIGANGAGKSTLLMSLFGQPKPKNGSIRFKGEELTRLATHQVGNLGIALVPEGRRVFSSMTIEENLMMGGAGCTADKDDPVLAHVYELFPRLKERQHQRAGTLSGGEQQMLAIGRALMSRPDLLLLDEPSLGLAPLVIKKIFETLEMIAKEGTTIFLVEQNANYALKFADRGYVLVNGNIKLTGSGDELLADPEVRKAYLGGH